MGPAWSWSGLALAALGPLAFFAWIFATKPARTDRHPVGYSIVSGLGLAITMAMAWRHGEAAGIVHVWAALILVCWMIYLAWYSPFNHREAGLLASGQILPEFNLQNTSGEMISSRQFTGQAVVWLFYRGNWCPFCTAQIGELARKYREIEATGAGVLLISPQSLDKHKALAGRFDMPMQFLRDPGNRAAKKLGIFNAWGTPLGMQALGYDSDTVLPTVFITDQQGKIIYSHLTDNYRIRAEPDEFLRVLKDDNAKKNTA
jgi:peroxiredoxin